MAAIAPRLFFRAGQTNDDAEQLLRLFWSRAELKKQFDDLRDDNFALRERLREEEILKLHLQQRIEQLEAMLTNPDTAAAAMTYFQLRSLWHNCSVRLADVADQLTRQHHEVENRKHVAKFRRELYKSLSHFQRQLGDVNREGEALSREIVALREQRTRRQGLWNLFNRRALTAEINLKRSQRRAITMRLGELTEEMQSCSGALPPPFPGFEVAIKRSVNLTLIAYAQELYLHFAADELASAARDASIMQLTEVQYGGRRACREMCRKLEARCNLLETDTSLDERARARAEYLLETVVYNRDEDALPSAMSLQAIPVLTPDMKLRNQLYVNILADEYWDLPAAVLT